MVSASQHDATKRVAVYKQLAGLTVPTPPDPDGKPDGKKDA
jgi:hypothetical protein